MRRHLRDEDPRERLQMAVDALAAVEDLMVNGLKPGRNDMHLVDPENLCSLLRLIGDEFQRALTEMERRAA